MLCSSLMPDKVPYFNAPIYLQNKSVIGKVDEILGPINEVYFSVKMGEGMVASSFKKGDKVYIGGDKLLPIDRFLPKPKAAGGTCTCTSLLLVMLIHSRSLQASVRIRPSHIHFTHLTAYRKARCRTRWSRRPGRRTRRTPRWRIPIARSRRPPRRRTWRLRWWWRWIRWWRRPWLGRRCIQRARWWARSTPRPGWIPRVIVCRDGKYLPSRHLLPCCRAVRVGSTHVHPHTLLYTLYTREPFCTPASSLYTRSARLTSSPPVAYRLPPSPRGRCVLVV